MFSVAASFRVPLVGGCRSVFKPESTRHARVFCQSRFSLLVCCRNLKRTTRQCGHFWTLRSLERKRFPTRVMVLSRALSNGAKSEAGVVKELSRETGTTQLKKNDFSRILSLAKPERYRLAGTALPSPPLPPSPRRHYLHPPCPNSNNNALLYFKFHM